MKELYLSLGYGRDIKPIEAVYRGNNPDLVSVETANEIIVNVRIDDLYRKVGRIKNFRRGLKRGINNDKIASPTPEVYLVGTVDKIENIRRN